MSPIPRRLAVVPFSGLVALLPTALNPIPAAAQEAAPYDPALFRELDFRMVGPTLGGRVTAVAGHRARPGTFWMGASGGGVWRTEDYGATWVPSADDALATGSIGSIRVADSDPDVVWVGTGSEAIRSNVIVGKGVYRSVDAGATWRHVGLEGVGQIGAVLVHPTDPDRAWVAALGNPWARSSDRGVFRTADGGRTWEKVLFTSDSVGAVDLEMHPTNPDILYAAMWRAERKPWTIISGMAEAGREDGIWRSEDGGDTWAYVPLHLPSGLVGKIDFAVSPAAPDRVYALVETKEPDEGLYRSDDAGKSWRLVSHHEPLMDRPFYYTNVDADPTDADVVYVNATQFWKSTDGGLTWRRLDTPHGDNHDMWINPDDPDLFVQSNDGGANVTRDGGGTWSPQTNQATAELYQVHADDRFPYWLYAGQQDRSTIMVPSAPPAESSVVGPEGWWKDVGGCETGPAVPKPGDADIVYSNCKGRFGRYSHLTGQEQQYYVGAADMYGHNPADLAFRFQRVVPIEVSPLDPDVVYHGSQYVHRTTDGGRTWETISPDLTAFRPERQVESGEPITRDITGEEHYSVLYVITPSSHDPDVIWTGANDGPVHVTRDGGRTWTDVTPPAMPPEGRIDHIEVSPHRPATAYVAGYRTLLGDLAPYAWRTDDFGATWKLLTPGDNGIPADDPVRVVREDPVRPGLLWAGTEFGLFVSFDDGGRWQPFQLDLPVTPVTDIRVVGDDLVLSTMGRSFWVLDDLAPLRQIDEAAGSDAPYLYAPPDAWRVRGRGSLASGPAVRPEYAPPGAILDYFLPEAAREVRVQILEGDGTVVRDLEPPAGDTGAGHHRLVWDLAWDAPSGRRSGPLAVPGAYRVRLTADGTTRERSLRVRMDPRVEADGVTVADLEAQLALGMRVLELQAAAEETTERVRGHLEELGAEDGQQRRALTALRDRLVDAEVGSYPQPMLRSQISYLYGMISRADQPPGRDAYTRLEELEGRLEGIRSELARIERTLAHTGAGQPRTSLR